MDGMPPASPTSGKRPQKFTPPMQSPVIKISKKDPAAANNKDEKDGYDLYKLISTIGERQNQLLSEFSTMRVDIDQKLNKLAEVMDAKINLIEEKSCRLEEKQIELEDRLNRIERDQKRNNIIISGLKPPEDPKQLRATVEKLLSGTLKQDVTITEAYKIPTNRGDSKIVAKLATAEHKTAIMENKGRLAKALPDVFISSDLIAKDRIIAFKARELRRTILAAHPYKELQFTRTGQIIHANGIKYQWNVEKQEFSVAKN